jgi:hypothetical protein
MKIQFQSKYQDRKLIPTKMHLNLTLKTPNIFKSSQFLIKQLKILFYDNFKSVEVTLNLPKQLKTKLLKLLVTITKSKFKSQL